MTNLNALLLRRAFTVYIHNSDVVKPDELLGKRKREMEFVANLYMGPNLGIGELYILCI